MYSWPILSILALVVFFLVKGAMGVMLKERESAGRLQTLESEAEQLEAREIELRSGIAKLQTQEGIMEEIKEKFSVTREGEYVAIIVDESLKATTTEKTGKSKFKGLWGGIKSLWRK